MHLNCESPPLQFDLKGGCRFWGRKKETIFQLGIFLG